MSTIDRARAQLARARRVDGPRPGPARVEEPSAETAREPEPPDDEPDPLGFVRASMRRVREAGASSACPHPARVPEQHAIFACAEIGPLAKCLAVYVLNRSAGRLNRGVCSESVPELGRALAAPPRQIDRALAQLHAVGWLTTRRQWNRPAERSIELP